MKTIIWDWNGTLLDDLDVCINVVNGMLQKRNLPVITHETYQAHFGFPVKDFYQKIGFDVSNGAFEQMSYEYIAAYLAAFDQCGLQPHVKETLKHAVESGHQNYLLSAMEQKTLEKSVTSHALTDYFKSMKGITDFHAKGKLERGQQLFDEQGILPSETVLIGDTTHDFEVARGLGCGCVLVSNGHYAADRLIMETDVSVIGNVKEALYLINALG